MKQEIIDKLLLHAKKKLLHDNEDACVYDYSGEMLMTPMK